MHIPHAKELVALSKRKEELKVEVSQINERIDQLAEMLLPQMIVEGMQNMSVDGKTLYIHKDIGLADKPDRDEVTEALKLSELDGLIEHKYNTNSLVAHIRGIAKGIKEDCLREKKLYTIDLVQAALPEPLREVIRLKFWQEVRMRES